MCPCSSCHSHLKRDEWRRCLCVYGADTLFSSSSLSLHLAGPALTLGPRLCLKTNCGGGSGYRNDRCAAGCRVARRLEYRCMADRYHNHTSPLLSLTYWIKHLPSCSWIYQKRKKKSGGKETFWSVFEISGVTREKRIMILNTCGPQSCFYLRHLQIDPPAVWQHSVPGCCSWEENEWDF